MIRSYEIYPVDDLETSELQQNRQLLFQISKIIQLNMDNDGITNKHLAKKMNVSEYYLNRIFCGDVDVDMRTLSDITFYLGYKLTFSANNKDSFKKEDKMPNKDNIEWTPGTEKPISKDWLNDWYLVKTNGKISYQMGMNIDYSDFWVDPKNIPDRKIKEDSECNKSSDPYAKLIKELEHRVDKYMNPYYGQKVRFCYELLVKAKSGELHLIDELEKSFAHAVKYYRDDDVKISYELLNKAKNGDFD